MHARQVVVLLVNAYETAIKEKKLNMDVHKNDSLEVSRLLSEFAKSGVAPTSVWLQHAESAKEVFMCVFVCVCTDVIFQGLAGTRTHPVFHLPSH